MTTEINTLPTEVNIHAHIGDPFTRNLLISGLDVGTKAWTVTSPLTVTTSGTDTVVLSLPATGPMVTRWRLMADGDTVISGTLKVDAAAADSTDVVAVAVPGPPGPQGITPQWWAGTQAEYDALPTKDASTLYVITG